MSLHGGSLTEDGHIDSGIFIVGRDRSKVGLAAKRKHDEVLTDKKVAGLSDGSPVKRVRLGLKSIISTVEYTDLECLG